jgi:hypothetical protein
MPEITTAPSTTGARPEIPLMIDNLTYDILRQSMDDTIPHRIERLRDRALDLMETFGVDYVGIAPEAVHPKRIGPEGACLLNATLREEKLQIAQDKSGGLVIKELMTYEEARRFRGATVPMRLGALAVPA